MAPAATSAESVIPSSSVSARSGRHAFRDSCSLDSPSPSKSSSPSGMPFSSVSNIRGFVRAQYSSRFVRPSPSGSPSASEIIRPVSPTCATATPPFDTHHVSPSSIKPSTWPDRISQFVVVLRTVVVLVPSTVVLVVTAYSPISTAFGHSDTTTSPLTVLTTSGQVTFTHEAPASSDELNVRSLRRISTSAAATCAQAGSYCE